MSFKPGSTSKCADLCLCPLLSPGLNSRFFFYDHRGDNKEREFGTWRLCQTFPLQSTVIIFIISQSCKWQFSLSLTYYLNPNLLPIWGTWCRRERKKERERERERTRWPLPRCVCASVLCLCLCMRVGACVNTHMCGWGFMENLEWSKKKGNGHQVSFLSLIITRLLSHWLGNSMVHVFVLVQRCNSCTG